MSERQAQVRAGALTEARDLAFSVLADLNDADRDPETRAAARLRRGILPIPGFKFTEDEAREVAADNAEGIATALRLLESWDENLVRGLLPKITVKGAEFSLQANGRVELEPRLWSGPAAALAAHHLAQARFLLRSVDGGSNPFKRRIKRCVNPTCGKWFFDAERGTRNWCCVACGNAHRQLKLAGDKYSARLKSGEYKQRRCPCSRPDCEG